MLWRASNLGRVRNCGRAAVDSDAGVSLRLRDGLSGYAGLQHCGSVWAEPVCAGRILVHRALEIGAVLGQAVRTGHSLGFVTLTMRHHAAQPLELLWSAGQQGWQRAISGRAWVKAQRDVDGWVRVWEVTHGRNGWHVHVHLVLVMSAGVTAATLDDVAGGMFERWSRGLEAKGLDAPLRVGQDWHLVRGDAAAEHLGGYLAKMADSTDDRGDRLGLELTHGRPGRTAGGLGTATTWALLDELVRTGEAESLRRWHEWERVSKGKRQVGWSRGLRDRFAPSVEERSDDEIVAEEVGSHHDDVVRWSLQQWREFARQPARMVQLLEFAEAGGASAVRAALEAWGVEYEATTGGHRHGTEH